MKTPPLHPMHGLKPLVALKDFDWRRLQRLADPNAMKDLDHFLDNLPQRAGKNALIIAVSMWFIAAVSLFLLFQNTMTLQDIQKQLSLAEGNQVMVPKITYDPVDPQLIKPILDRLKKIYPSLTFELQSGNDLVVKGASTRDFPAWRAALGDLSNGAPSWKIKVKKFCSGSGCAGEPLSATVSVHNVNIHMPEAPAEETPNETTKP